MCGLKSGKVAVHNPRGVLHEACIANDRHNLVPRVTLYSDLRNMPVQCHSTLLCYPSGPQAPSFQTISERVRSFALFCARCDGRGGPRVLISIFNPYDGVGPLRLFLEEIAAPSGEVTVLSWSRKSSPYNSCLPASISILLAASCHSKGKKWKTYITELRSKLPPAVALDICNQINFLSPVCVFFSKSYQGDATPRNRRKAESSSS